MPSLTLFIAHFSMTLFQTQSTIHSDPDWNFRALTNDDWPGAYVFQSVINMTDAFLILSIPVSFLIYKKLKE